MRTKSEIQRMVSVLKECHQEMISEIEKATTKAQIEVLSGKSKSSQYEGAVKKAAIVAEKWLAKKAYDCELFES